MTFLCVGFIQQTCLLCFDAHFCYHVTDKNPSCKPTPFQMTICWKPTLLQLPAYQTWVILQSVFIKELFVSSPQDL